MLAVHLTCEPFVLRPVSAFDKFQLILIPWVKLLQPPLHKDTTGSACSVAPATVIDGQAGSQESVKHAFVLTRLDKLTVKLEFDTRLGVHA